MSARAHIVRRLATHFVQQLRARLAMTGDDAAQLVDKLDHGVTEGVVAQVCERLGLPAEAAKPHPWGHKGLARSTKGK